MSAFDIATMGSSLTACNAIERSWQAELRSALAIGKSSEIFSYNFGVGGGNINTGHTVKDRVITLRPSAILIEYSMNDCNLDFSYARTQTIALLDDLKAGTPGSLLFLMTMNPVVGDSLSATLRDDLGIYYQMYRDLAVSEDVGLIDTTPDWSGVTEDDIPDGIHPLPATNASRLVPGIVAGLSAYIT